MIFKSADDVAQAYRRRFRREPDPAAWEKAVQWKWIADVVDEPDELDSVLARIRELEGLRHSPRERIRETRKELPPDERANALAQIRAVEAARMPLVEAFRSECLQGRFLKPNQVQEWIEQREHEQGEPARYVKRWERANGDRVQLPNWRSYGLETRLEFGDSSEGVFLLYPGGSVQVSADSELGRLKFVAAALIHRYLWAEDEAVGFILSGTVPRPFAGYTKIRHAPKTPRITIEVDSRVRAEEVLKLYKWARASLSTQARSLSELHARLAVFAAQRNDGRAWNLVFAEWNEVHGDHSYSELSNFIRDSRKAYERITGATLDWKGRRGDAGHRTHRRRVVSKAHAHEADSRPNRDRRPGR